MDSIQSRDLPPPSIPSWDKNRSASFDQPEWRTANVREVDARVRELSVKCAVQEERLAFVDKLLDEYRTRSWQARLFVSTALVVVGVVSLVSAVSR